jgi:hypothetical protein
MKIKLNTTDGKPFMIIAYEDSEWEQIETILKKTLGLEKREIANCWGHGLKAECYVERKAELKEYLQKTFKDNISGVYDNLNDRFYQFKDFNIAFLRVIPDSDGKIQIPLEKFLTVVEVNEIAQKIVSIYKVLLNIATGVEVSITLKNGNEKGKGK